jgi:hypothetical protein
MDDRNAVLAPDIDPLHFVGFLHASYSNLIKLLIVLAYCSAACDVTISVTYFVPHKEHPEPRCQDD